ncbi:MAG: ORF6N domain-containing protein [Gemmatimonadota bacterium]
MTVSRQILECRGFRVLLDHDLATLYGVTTRALNQAVSRNRTRFPADFMFRLTAREADNLRSQIVTSSSHGGRRYRPRAFTEQGVAMLSSVLRGRRAVTANIAIMRAFVELRGMLASNHALNRRVDDLERRYDGQFADVFEAIRQLIEPPFPAQPQIGFRPEKETGRSLGTGRLP